MPTLEQRCKQMEALLDDLRAWPNHARRNVPRDPGQPTALDEAAVKEGAKLIPLTRGRFAIVDAADFEWLSQYNWSLYAKRYAGRGGWHDGRSTSILMHRFIMRAPSGVDVDHKNGNKLDNRRGNLRLATRSQNGCNRGAAPSNTSGYKGVAFCKQTQRWQAQIKINGKTKKLGRFPTKEKAYESYCKAAADLHGEFARVA